MQKYNKNKEENISPWKEQNNVSILECEEETGEMPEK